MVTKDMYSQKVKEVCKIIAEHIVEDKTGGVPDWPFSFAEREMYLGPFFPKELYITIKKLEKRGLSPEEIAKLFKNPSRIAHFFYTSILPSNNLTKEENVELVEKLVDFISYFRKEDIFCRNEKNIIWSKEDIRKHLPLLKKVEDDKTKKLIGEIDALLFQYNELIFGGIPAFGHEFHGPYQINDEFLIVKEHYDLQPVEIWLFAQKFPFEKITVLEIFKEGKVKFDFFNHIETSFSLPEKLSKYCILADKEEFTGSIEEFKNKLLKIITEANNFIRNFDKEDWIKKSIEMWCYYLKPCKDILNENWRILYSFRELKKKVKESTREFMKKRGEKLESSDEKAIEGLTHMFLKKVYKEA
jgi:hypothetical protein